MKKFDLKISLIIGKLLHIIGSCSYAMAVLTLIIFLDDGFDSLDTVIIGLAFFIVVGLALRNAAKKIKVNADNVRQYVPIIVNGNVRKLDNIAETTGKPYETVKSDIQKIIQKGYLKNAYIDESTHEIVLPVTKVATVENIRNNAASASKKLATRVVACPCCGANNTIDENSSECEYCGSSLN